MADRVDGILDTGGLEVNEAGEDPFSADVFSPAIERLLQGHQVLQAGFVVGLDVFEFLGQLFGITGGLFVGGFTVAVGQEAVSLGDGLAEGVFGITQQTAPRPLLLRLLEVRWLDGLAGADVPEFLAEQILDGARGQPVGEDRWLGGLCCPLGPQIGGIVHSCGLPVIHHLVERFGPHRSEGGDFAIGGVDVGSADRPDQIEDPPAQADQRDQRQRKDQLAGMHGEFAALEDMREAEYFGPTDLSDFVLLVRHG